GTGFAKLLADLAMAAGEMELRERSAADLRGVQDVGRIHQPSSSCSGDQRGQGIMPPVRHHDAGRGASMPVRREREEYNRRYGATTGDRIRLADTNLFARV